MNTGKTIINNFIWRFSERFIAQFVTFIVSVILARILGPDAYGTIALVNIFIMIFSIFIDGGFSSALIQKKDADDIDFSSVFYLNIFICLLLYLILFIIAPCISSFYNTNLTPIIRVLGLTLVVSGFKNIQSTYVSKNLLYKKYFFSTIIGTLISAIVGIWMAYNNYGVWALVCQSLTNNIVDTIILWITVKWRPTLYFSFSRIKILFDFGWKLLISSIINTFWGQLRQLIIGKKYTTEDLAYYDKGNHFPEIMTSSFLSSIDSVLFPSMSKVQDNIQKVKEMMRKSIRLGSYVLWPMMIGLAACSDNFVKLLLTEKWMPIVPYLKIFCITYAFYPIHTSNLNAISALGRSDIFLKIEIMKKISSLIVILIFIPYGVYAIALSTILSSILSQLINSWPNRKLLDYKYIDQLKDLMPALFMSLIMGVIVYSVNFINLNCFVTLILQVVLGVVVYIVISKISNNDSYIYCKNILLSLFKRNK